MNPYEITEIHRTWELASSRMPLFVQLFCAHIQSIDNRQRALFGDDARTNALLLLRLVGIAVNGLNQPRILFPLLETLGRQNAWRIANARQSCVAIRALLWTRKATLGPSFNRSTRRAWLAGYRAVAQAMSAGMAKAAAGNGWHVDRGMRPISRYDPTIARGSALTPQQAISRWYV